MTCNNLLIRIGIGILLLGLIVTLPTLNLFIIDFAEMSASAITVFRLGLLVILFGVILK